MARWPCLHCDQRYEGEQQNVYLQVYDGESRLSLRYAVCPESLETILSEWWPRALVRDAYGRWCDADVTQDYKAAFQPTDAAQHNGRATNGYR